MFDYGQLSKLQDLEQECGRHVNSNLYINGSIDKYNEDSSNISVTVQNPSSNQLEGIMQAQIHIAKQTERIADTLAALFAMDQDVIDFLKASGKI